MMHCGLLQQELQDIARGCVWGSSLATRKPGLLRHELGNIRLDCIWLAGERADDASADNTWKWL